MGPKQIPRYPTTSECYIYLYTRPRVKDPRAALCMRRGSCQSACLPVRSMAMRAKMGCCATAHRDPFKLASWPGALLRAPLAPPFETREPVVPCTCRCAGKSMSYIPGSRGRLSDCVPAPRHERVGRGGVEAMDARVKGRTKCFSPYHFVSLYFVSVRIRGISKACGKQKLANLEREIRSSRA